MNTCIDCGKRGGTEFGRFENGQYVTVVRCEPCRIERNRLWREREGLRPLDLPNAARD